MDDVTHATVSSGSITFTTPAGQAIKDFSDTGHMDQLAAFQAAWNTNVTGWTQMSIDGNPWTNANDAPRAWYFNPVQTGWPKSDAHPIQWVPFPNRLLTFFTNTNAKQSPQLDQPLTQEQLLALTDTGQVMVNDKTYALYGTDPTAPNILKIPGSLCPEIEWSGEWVAFAPFGPRGWLDEYCEWSVKWVDDKVGGKIQSIMYTCENPAYWLTLWRHDPNIVLELYRNYIDATAQLEDLYLRYPTGSDKAGQPVPDPVCGGYAYDPTNKWNRGTLRLPGQSGGAMHLTSAPNTLSAEIYLAAASTIQRETASWSNPQALICCSHYGQNFRNSDPHIGASGNKVASKYMIALADPVGLYIQTPDWSGFKAPDGSNPSEFWTIKRGHVGDGEPGMDSILQAVYEVPADKGYTVSDLTINGQPIQWAGQIAQQFRIALRVNAMAPSEGVPPNNNVACMVQKTGESVQPAPAQFLPETLLYGGSPSDLPAALPQGKTVPMALVVSGADKHITLANAYVQFDHSGVSAKVTGFLPDAGSIPGQTSGGGTQAFLCEVTVTAGTAPGLIGVRALNPWEDVNVSAEAHPYTQGLALIV